MLADDLDSILCVSKPVRARESAISTLFGTITSGSSDTAIGGRHIHGSNYFLAPNNI
jgi:hypothetical protein